MSFSPEISVNVLMISFPPKLSYPALNTEKKNILASRNSFSSVTVPSSPVQPRTIINVIIFSFVQWTVSVSFQKGSSLTTKYTVQSLYSSVCGFFKCF